MPDRNMETETGNASRFERTLIEKGTEFIGARTRDHDEGEAIIAALCVALGDTLNRAETAEAKLAEIRQAFRDSQGPSGKSEP